MDARTISTSRSCASTRNSSADGRQAGCKSKRKEWRRNFTLVPRDWELRLLEPNGSAPTSWRLELLYLHWLGKGKPIAVSSTVANAANLSARSKSNALAELERLGLITVDRSVRRSRT